MDLLVPVLAMTMTLEKESLSDALIARITRALHP